jgi:hypothetical protein
MMARVNRNKEAVVAVLQIAMASEVAYSLLGTIVR